MEFRINTDYKVRQITLAFKIPFIPQTLRFSIQNYQAPNTWTRGISSRCTDGLHVLFFDYDSQDYIQICDEITFLQKHFNLGNAHVFKLDREGSFHVIILDKMTVSTAHSILKETNVDWGYKESVKRVRGREWILRVDKKGKRLKPVYHSTIESKHSKAEISTAHRMFLEMWYDMPKFKYLKEDNIKQIPVIDYNTGNRCF